MTSAEVLVELRKQLQDTAASQRYDDTDCYLRLTRAQRYIADNHPEAMCSDTAVVVSRPGSVLAGTDPELNDAYFMALVHYAAYLIFGEDAEDLGNAKKARWHLEQFQMEVS